MSSAARALVLGGAGFVGSHLCEALLAAGTEVVCVDNFCTGRAGNLAHLDGCAGLRVVEHDVTRPLPDLGSFRWIFSLASAASPVDYQRLPIETLRAGAQGTEHALQLAGRLGARFVLASTSEVYGDPDVHPQVEDYPGRVNPIGPRSVYDEAKRFAEALTSAYRRSLGVDTGIARIFNTYGPRMRPDDGRMVPTFIRQALAGEPLTVTGTGRQTRSLCYVTDTVAGLMALARSDESGPVNIGNPHEQTVLEVAVQIAELVGGSAAVAFSPPVEDDPHRRCPDITLARQRLGWAPTVPVRSGLQRTIDWFQAASEDRRRSESPIGVLPR
jgi:dTDP-glucose 4,6-dehydratase